MQIRNLRKIMEFLKMIDLLYIYMLFLMPTSCAEIIINTSL